MSVGMSIIIEQLQEEVEHLEAEFKDWHDRALDAWSREIDTERRAEAWKAVALGAASIMNSLIKEDKNLEGDFRGLARLRAHANKLEESKVASEDSSGT